jgi:hypothetical protein
MRGDGHGFGLVGVSDTRIFAMHTQGWMRPTGWITMGFFIKISVGLKPRRLRRQGHFWFWVLTFVLVWLYWL